MSILLSITTEMEYNIKCLKFILFFTNSRQKLTAKGLNNIDNIVVNPKIHVLLSYVLNYKCV